MRYSRHTPRPPGAAEDTHLEPDERPPGEASLGRSLATVVEQAARFSPDCCGAIATLTDDTAASAPAGPDATGLPDGPGEVAATHPDLAALVAVQRACGDGPLLTALETGRPAGGDDLLTLDRWPVYRAKALDSGLRSCTTLPYRRDGLTLTLTVCSFRPNRLDEAVRDSTALLGALAASVLVREVRYQAALEEVEQLDTALRSRPVVDRACGIVMAVTGCDDDKAFGLLRTLSQRGNRKLHDVAEAVVRTRGRGLPEKLRKLDNWP
ncbi:ANTAR domain-containing protein [Streptomyces sp. NPDC048172]|uniref:ANTAR domain-containing protein n=1 Tax=Streptomyces sp. NPDC048172 TaxID=3365505 RepID=UPI0037151B23